MKTYIEQRAIEVAQYIIENKATVRQAAKAFGISKSTVHKDLTDEERLPAIDADLAEGVRKVLAVNKSERHLRGGMATKQKYAHRQCDVPVAGSLYRANARTTGETKSFPGLHVGAANISTQNKNQKKSRV